MAIQWGYESGNSQGVFALGIDVWAVGNTVSVDYWIYSRYNVSNVTTLNKGGVFGGTESFNMVFGSGGGTMLIGSTRTFTASPGQSYNISGHCSGIFNGATPSASITYTHPINQPVAPGKPVLTRNSDSAITASWQVNNSSSAPYNTTRLYRREGNPTTDEWSATSLVMSVSGYPSSYQDTATVSNRWYKYRVGAVNGAGETRSDWSNPVGTTPAAPSNLAASKSGSSDIIVTGTRNDVVGDSTIFEWQDNPGGTGWVNITGTTATPNRTFTGVNTAVTHQYRSRARITSQTPSTYLYSDWSKASNTVQLLAAPNAPTLLSPSGVWDRSLPLVFAWQHNPVDTTAQTVYELDYSLNGGSSWTTLSGTTAQTRTVTTLVGQSGQVGWRVRTKGSHTAWSAYSQIGVVTLAAAPTASISSPTPVWEEGTVTLEWTFFSSDGAAQTAFEAILQTGDGVSTLEAHTGTTASVQPFTRILVDSTTYRAGVRVRSSEGLWSEWDYEVFVTDFPSPFPATLSAVFNPDTGATVLAATQDTSNPENVVPIRTGLQRLIEGVWVTLAEDMGSASITDRTHPVSGEVCWRAITTSASGAVTIGETCCVTFGDVNLRDGSVADVWVDSAYLSAGPGFSMSVRINANIGAKLLVEESGFGRVDQTLHRFAGRQFPVSFEGNSLGTTLSVQFATFPEDNPAGWVTLTQVRELLMAAGSKLWRDPTGRCFPVMVEPVDITPHTRGLNAVSVKMTRVDDRGVFPWT